MSINASYKAGFSAVLFSEYMARRNAQRKLLQTAFTLSLAYFAFRAHCGEIYFQQNQSEVNSGALGDYLQAETQS